MNRVAAPLPGERVLWEGRPLAAAFARDVLHLRVVAFYFGALLIWQAWNNRQAGLSPGATLLAAVPLGVLGLLLLGAIRGFAAAIARTTRYTVTSERVLIHFGLALTATVSLPLRQISAVAFRKRADGSGDIPLTLKSASPGFLKLWPHVRPWSLSRPQPMLRCLPEASRLAVLLSEAAYAAQGQGQLTEQPLAPAAGSAPAGVLAHA